jgi:hypothetical protein
VIPGWVQSPETLHRWVSQALAKYPDQAIDLINEGVGTTLQDEPTETVTLEGIVDLGCDLQLDFDITITFIITHDHRVVVEQDTYSFHLRDPDRPIIWRYDRHDDHHGLGTEFHIHDRSDDNVRASGEVDLAMILTLADEVAELNARD